MKSVDAKIRFLYLVTFVFYTNLLQVLSTVAEDPLLAQCKQVKCRAGRECRVLSTGTAECVCMRKCPKRNHPVCGSNGLLYESHCELHREACLVGQRIHPVLPDKSCTNNPLAKFKRKLQKDMDEIRRKEAMKIRVPRACHQNDRDRTREFLVSWVQLVAAKHLSAFHEDLSYEDLIVEHFKKIDMHGDGNTYVDPDEWLKYFLETKKNSANKVETTNVHLRKKKSQLEKLRKLCIEALVEEGDRDQDWRLTSQEFSTLMNPDYQPSRKYCKRESRRFEDGTRIKVDCNGCTCACGKWICTSKLCESEAMDTDDQAYYGLYEDMDNIVMD